MLRGKCYLLGNGKGRYRRPVTNELASMMGHRESRSSLKVDWGQGLTETVPQVKQLMVKHAATHTQPYPPSGGVLLSVVSSTATSSASTGGEIGHAAEGACCFDIEGDAKVACLSRGLLCVRLHAIGMVGHCCVCGVSLPQHYLRR
jgi:hypothetical protein